MHSTNTHHDYQGTATDLAIALDLAMVADDMARWDYLFTTGTSWANLATEEQHAEYARKARIARAMIEGAATGVLPV
jgi:hypothetical protein